jgi:lysyl-tRNA synthetase class 2
VAEAFAAHAPMALREALRRDLFDEMMVEHIEPHLGKGKPTFIYDYPAELGALARTKPGNPEVAERFELYVGGLELANGFSELTDAVEQRCRFEQAQGEMDRNGRTPGPMPEVFLAALPDMPEAAGIALGVDRLAMIFLGVPRIDQAVSFVPEEL